MTTSTASFTKLSYSNSVSENEKIRQENLLIWSEINEDFSEISQWLEANGFDSTGSEKRGFVGSVASQLRKNGFLSDKQTSAVRNVISQNGERKEITENASSKHLGKVGDALKMALKIDRKLKVFVQNTRYNPSGVLYINLMSDSQGNRVVYQGSANSVLSQTEDSIVEFELKVKDHRVREGIAQTIVSHPKAGKVLKGFPKGKTPVKVKVAAKTKAKAA